MGNAPIIHRLQSNMTESGEITSSCLAGKQKWQATVLVSFGVALIVSYYPALGINGRT